MRYYHTPIRVTKIKIRITQNIGKDVEKLKLPDLPGGNIKMIW